MKEKKGLFELKLYLTIARELDTVFHGQQHPIDEWCTCLYHAKTPTITWALRMEDDMLFVSNSAEAGTFELYRG